MITLYSTVYITSYSDSPHNQSMVAVVLDITLVVNGSPMNARKDLHTSYSTV
jgi:hypothetical protein